MTNQQKETVWITIPDEATPALEATVNTPYEGSTNKVTNKAFWGVGFVALVIFSSVLFAPQEIVGLMKAQLFDGTFQVVPDYQDQGGTLFTGGEEDEVAAEEEQAFENETVVEAESDAVSIQIEPLADTDTEASVDGETVADSDLKSDSDSSSDTEVATDAATEAESIIIDDLGAAHAAAEEVSEANEGLDSDAELLQSLSQQLDEFKKKEIENEQKIQDLIQILEAQALGIPGVGTTQVPSGGQAGTQASAQFGLGTSTGTTNGVYRYNTHTVSVSPHDILAQNRGVGQQASYQANIAYQGVQAYSNQAYNPVLSGVQGQPDTGPAESFLFALVLTSIGILIWGSLRAIKA